jgi:hypothetical protein
MATESDSASNPAEATCKLGEQCLERFKTVGEAQVGIYAQNSRKKPDRTETNQNLLLVQ